MASSPQPSIPALGGQVRSGLRWGMADAALQQIMRLVISVVLTRLVAPDDFGLLAMALVFSQLATFVGDLGLGPALVQREVVEERHRRTAFTATAVVGLVFGLLFLGLSWPVAAFYDEPQLQPVLAVLATTYVFRGLVGVPRELLRRDMRFRTLLNSSMWSVGLSGVVGIGLAVAGAGVWALVISVLVENAVAVIAVLVLLRRSHLWRPAFGIHRGAFRDLAGFGASVSGTRIAYYGVTNIDNLIVGKVLGATSLGLYNLAYRVMLFPILKVADVVANVTMPALAMFKEDRVRVARAFVTTVQRLALICFPVTAATIVLAPAVIPLVFGDRWMGAVPVVQILALNGFRLAIARLNGAVYEAVGRPHWDFAVLSALLVVYTAAFAIGVHWQIKGVAWAYTIAGYALWPLDQFLVAKALGRRPFWFASQLTGVSVATACMAATLMVIRHFIATDSVVVVLGTAAGTAVYLVALAVVSPGMLRKLVGEIKN